MASAELIVLDVGHGSCTLVRCAAEAVVVDAPTKNVLMDTLRLYKVTRIPAIFVTHADRDHVAGITSVLLDRPEAVDAIYVNGDALKGTDAWEGLRHAVAFARKAKRDRPLQCSGFNSDDQDAVAIGSARVDVLFPTPEVAMGSAGGKDLNGKRLTSNSVSAVIEVQQGDKRLALIAGDIDGVGLDNLLAEGSDLKTEILVFLHHGGLPGNADPTDFAKKLTAATKPSLVMISNGRGLHGTPRPEVITGIRQGFPDAHVMCTELSEHCCPQATPIADGHLQDIPARGRANRHCCGGSVAFVLESVSDALSVGLVML